MMIEGGVMMYYYKGHLIREVRYLTDDRDRKTRTVLVIRWEENGDWYVATTIEDQGILGKAVRLSTSGGASSRVPGMNVCYANIFQLLVKAGPGQGVTLISNEGKKFD